MSARAERTSLWDGPLSDGSIIRAAFFIMLAGTAGVLYLDFKELTAADIGTAATPYQPILPAFDPANPALPPAPAVTTDYATLREPLAVELGASGALLLTGTIDPGAAARVAEEIAERGEYVSTVVFDSPGGSVNDAMEIGTLIRERGYATRVEAGGLCASSCPLAFAGGTAREADAAAVVGIHQIYAAARTGAPPLGAQATGHAMSEAQMTTAAISRHLDAMDVDPALWLHALETPPDRLYYLTPAEMTAYRLVTRLIEADSP